MIDDLRRLAAYAQAEGLDPDVIGVRAQVPGPENAWGAVVAPTIDPTRRPDVLNPSVPMGWGLRTPESRSSLISSSGSDYEGGPEVLYPTVTDDGREISPDEGFDLAMRTGKNLGVYSSVPMADQAAIAMHNAGAEQAQSPSFQPTGWYRADQPGVRYPSQAARDAGLMKLAKHKRAK